MFIFQKQLAQQKQLEEVNAAGAIRTLRDAVRSAVAVQRDDLVGYPEGVTLKDASEFLPQEYFSGFRVAVRREGAKLSAVIVSPTSLGRYALDNLSAARISSMLGASGGFVPSLTDEPSSTANGTLGLWSLDINEISAEFADPVRIVVNIEFSEELGGLPAEEKEKILYRTADYGQASNTMLTALFFNDGTKDTIRIDPDGSFTNGAFTINPDGSITNGSFTVGANGEIAAAGGRFSVDADGSGTFAGNLSVGGGMIINGRAFAWDHVARGGIYVEHDPRTNNWEDMKAAISMDAGGVNFHKADGTHTLSMANDSGNISSAGDIAATGTLRAGKVVVAGTACNAGEIAADNNGSTMLCLKGKWFAAQDPDLCETDNQGFTDKLFTADGTFTAPCTGSFEVTAVGGGGGGGWWAGSGGGSSAFGDGLVIGGGGGGGACTTNNSQAYAAYQSSGASGEHEIQYVTLAKEQSYSVKIGQGGYRGPYDSVTAGGAGYNAGGPTKYCHGNGYSLHCCGGDGANYKNNTVSGGTGNWVGFLWPGGTGGGNPGTSGSLTTYGIGYSISGKGTFGNGGPSNTNGSPGAVYVKLVK